LAREMTEFLFDQLQDSFVRHVTGGWDKQGILRKPLPEASLQRFTGKLSNGIGSTKDRSAERVFGPEAARENFMQQGFRVVEIHLDLFEHHLTFFRNVIGVEKRTQAKIGNDIERDREMIVEHFG